MPIASLKDVINEEKNASGRFPSVYSAQRKVVNGSRRKLRQERTFANCFFDSNRILYCTILYTFMCFDLLIHSSIHSFIHSFDFQWVKYDEFFNLSWKELNSTPEPSNSASNEGYVSFHQSQYFNSL